MTTGKEVPPHAARAEVAAVGSMMLAGDAGHGEIVAAVVGILGDGQDLYSDRLQHIYRAITAVHREGGPIDVVTVGDALDRAGRLAECGGHAYLLELLQSVPHAAHGEYYATIVREHASDRIIGQAARECAEVMADATATPDRRAAAVAAIGEATARYAARDGGSPTLADLWGEVDPRERPPREVFLIGDEFAGVDLEPGKIILVGAPPGQGKTALVMQWAIDAAIDDAGLSVLVANVEMGWSDLMDRQIARLADVPYHAIRDRGPLLRRIYGDPIGHALDLLEQIRDQIVFAGDPHVIESVEAEAGRRNPGLVILDYLQRIGPRGGADNPREAVGRTMTAARRMADAGACVVCVSAVGRQNGGGYRSGLDAYRESGDLEYSADDAWTIATDTPDSPVRPIRLKRVKCRNGRLRELPLSFDGVHQRFGAPDPALSVHDPEEVAV